MAENYVVSGADAKRYRQLHLASLDFTRARAMLAHVIVPGDADGALEEACWSAAVTRYVRPLKENLLIRDVWERALSALPTTQLELHRHLHILRDSMYSHSVGVGEDTAVTVNAGRDAMGHFTVYGVGIQSAWVSSPGTDAAKEFDALLAVLIPIFEEAEVAQHAAIFNRLRESPEEEITRLDKYVKTLNYDDSSKTYKDQKKQHKLPTTHKR